MREEHSFGIIPFSKLDTEWKVFVILHKKGNHWGFPKGHAEGYETPKDAATRELKEETGLEVDEFLLAAPLSEHYTFYRDRQKVIKTATYFPALVSGTPTLQEKEIREGRWLSFEMAMKTLTFSEGRALLNQVLHELKAFFQQEKGNPIL